jgi:hypothetical protein
MPPRVPLADRGLFRSLRGANRVLARAARVGALALELVRARVHFRLARAQRRLKLRLFLLRRPTTNEGMMEWRWERGRRRVSVSARDDDGRGRARGGRGV